MNNNKIKKITGVGILAAIVVVLQIIANYVTIGSVSITLSLIPIVIGAIIYGKNSGALLGFINGIVIILAPSTLSLFMPFNPLATIFICLIKTSIAGYIAGLIFELLNKKHYKLSFVLAALIVPIINTGLFYLGSILFFMPVISKFAPEGQNMYAYLFLGFIGINFLIEFAVNSLLSPTMIYIINTFKKLNNK